MKQRLYLLAFSALVFFLQIGCNPGTNRKETNNTTGTTNTTVENRLNETER
jgi:hypothetical protein